MNKDTKPTANPIVVLREEFDDWAVLFNPDTAEAVGINPVSVLIWKLLDGKHTVSEITAEVDKQFSKVPDAAPAEISRFIESLVKRGFAEFNPDEE